MMEHMSDFALGDQVTVGSRYWDHSEPGEVVEVDSGLVYVQVGSSVLKFPTDTYRIIDPEWRSSLWLELADDQQS
jgi:hypothetical protein